MGHELSSVSGICLLALTLLSLLAIVSRLLRVRTGTSSEPYHVPSAIPYLGHLLGIIWHRNRYYAKIRCDFHSCINLIEVF